jgi:hypothetical protein
MRAKVQIPSYYLYQLNVDTADLVRKFAELATLREIVRQKEAALHATRPPPKTSIASKAVSHPSHHRTVR